MGPLFSEALMTMPSIKSTEEISIPAEALKGMSLDNFHRTG